MSDTIDFIKCQSAYISAKMSLEKARRERNEEENKKQNYMFIINGIYDL